VTNPRQDSAGKEWQVREDALALSLAEASL